MEKDLKQALRMGIIGSGRITDRFMPETEFVDNLKVCAVFNPRRKSAEDFARKYATSDRPIEAFDVLGAFWDKIDVVYIAAPHEYHTVYVREALLSGKHVLCEKPFAVSGEEAAELYALAREKRLILMEAVKTACAPGFEGLLKLIGDGVIGTVHDVEACFTKLSPANCREYWSTYGGSFIELGSYSLLPIVRILGADPDHIHFHSVNGVNGADTYTKVTVDYENAMASGKTGLGVKSEGELIVAGSRGYIKVPAPWWLTKRVEVHHEDPNQVEVYEYSFEGAGLRYEICAFMKKILTLSKMQSLHSQPEIVESIWNYLEGIEGVTPEESVWMACVMEQFLENREIASPTIRKSSILTEANHEVAIWAHRGCCMYFPENTLTSFEEAARIPGLKGIELDVQLTKDGELVVIHDEKVDRTTNGKGPVRDYTLAELKELKITGSGNQEIYSPEEHIPTLEEVFTLLKPYCTKTGLLINIELKNSVIRYDGMEEKVLALVKKYDMQKNIIYSSFLSESMGLVRTLNPDAQTGILGSDIHECLLQRDKMDAQAVHPSVAGLDLNPELQEVLANKGKRIPVRAWNCEEPFFGQDRELKEHKMTKYGMLGVTDIITNVPELYLK